MNHETLGAQNEVKEVPVLIELSELQLALVGGGIGETILVK
jgi:hypothetical protein